MTLAQASASDPTALIREAIALLDAATAHVDPAPAARQPQLASPGTTLRLLVTGSAFADPDELSIPVVGARLVVVTTHQAAELLRLQHAGSLPRRAIETTIGGDWLVLTPSSPHRVGLDSAAREAQRFLADLARCGGARWHAGISWPLSSSADLPHAYHDACDAAALAALRHRQTVIVDDEWAALAVARLRHAAKDLIPARSPIEVLARHDREHGTMFGETLGIWLNLNCDTDAASRALGIHPNTLRYRLRRAAAVAGLDLNDPNQRLVLQLTQRIGEEQ